MDDATLRVIEAAFPEQLARLKTLADDAIAGRGVFDMRCDHCKQPGPTTILDKEFLCVACRVVALSKLDRELYR